MDLDLQGRIERFTLPEILQLIASSRKTGTLGIQKDDSIVMVYFKEGSVIYGYGPRQTFHLGQLLRERGVITDEQLEDAVRVQAKSENSKRLGEIMISRNYIDRADLEQVVIKQVKELLYSLLSWQSGSFKFYDNQFPTEEEITIDLSIENVILEGLRRVDEMNMVRETLPDLEAVFTISASQAGRKREVSLEADEWNIMALVDGRRSLDEVCKLGGGQRDETLKRLAHLKLAGLITKTEKKEEAASPQLDKIANRLAGLFEDYLTAKSPSRPAKRMVTETFVEEAD
ncbi:MAG: DUF4388 domain-containing protein [candidate division Zixibacteria bacterium]|nr:DUF4388 domain-containing protein [candidate division Zixibacteria bacterium]MDH3936605.1 DUF4388 domain-containing protein [candidate division Zixibacteria bacterium]MDH4034091.1 DUF4388 domain-containing protein [candidate division Zixibacteria bacterium]